LPYLLSVPTPSKDNCKLKLGDSAPDFELPAVDGREYSLEFFKDKRILVVFFTCNHCPYVQGWDGRIIQLQRDFAPQGVQFVGINANETVHYPEDSFDKMVVRAREIGINWVYLRDEKQEAARAYDAACTPEFYVFDSGRRLRYHGRLDDNYKDPEAASSHDLRDALADLAAGRDVRRPLAPAMGCSIKWA
jgi:peroxiredoxin